MKSQPANEGPRPLHREVGREVFDAVADTYDAVRPGYPGRVFEVLRERCGLGPGTRVLEIGAGSGQATRDLVAAGAHVVAVEPSPALGRLLLDRIASGVELLTGNFEDVRLGPGTFDLCVAATVFHWLDPDAALPAIASALRPGGAIALWWNEFGDPDQADPFHEATRSVLEVLDRSPSVGTGGIPYSLDAERRMGDLGRHGFTDLHHEAVRWPFVLEATRVRQLYATYSQIARLPAERRERILDEIERIAVERFGGMVTRRIVTTLYTGRLPQRAADEPSMSEHDDA